MRKILGLDLGSSSIGWAVINERENNNEHDTIEDIGCRIIPLSTDDANQFSKGDAITKNADRTARRTQRKGYDRFQLRRQALISYLQELGMMYGNELVGLTPTQLWGLRAKAVTEQISLPELGRVLCHLNQKRGYKSAKEDAGDKKQTDYVKKVNERYVEITELGQTIGQFMYANLCADSGYRCKEKVYPRAAYIEEFDRIITTQQKFYPNLLTDKAIDTMRNEIIYYQRRLRSCKHLVAMCEFEKVEYNKNGHKIFAGPKVAPRSSPLFQVCKLWESINNIVLKNRTNESLYITLEQKREIFDFMNTHDKLKSTDLLKILGLKKGSWFASKAIGAGLQGNTTRQILAKALEGVDGAEELLRFDLHYTDGTLVDETTGEIVRVVDASLEQEPLYQLWHTIYSISDPEELRKVLCNKFGITDEAALDRLSAIDFVKQGYGNKSVKAMRRLLPFLEEGCFYSDALIMAGYGIKSLTKEENESRELQDSLKLLDKGALRQPIVEKILNQMINVVNALMSKHGRFDEIRVELARELKQSREERKDTTDRINKSQRENDTIANTISTEYGLTPTRSRIQKYKMWKEAELCCMYCGQPVTAAQFLNGYDVEVEHIIPRSLLFDDSFSNKVCACRACNKEKNNRTAYDYMKSKGDVAFQDYIDRVNKLKEEKKISKTKFEKLMMPADKIPQDFIDRQLRESQYIAKKAKEMLQAVCYNVYSTSGSVTDFLRHLWGWDKVLEYLNMERYRLGGMTYETEDDNGQKIERIKDWSKRLDHRHHAVDALTIACTKQGYIQRLNNLQAYRDKMFESVSEQGEQFQSKLSLLEKYIISQPHFSTAEVLEAVSGIVVSFKAGKRVTTPGKRYVHRGGRRVLMQRGVLVPRGALSEESVYGKIGQYTKNKKGVVSLIDEYVIKYPLSKFDIKKAKDIVDADIRRRVIERLEEFGGTTAKAFAEPLLDHQGRPIRSVRCKTGLSAVQPVRRNEEGEPIAFVKPCNNHHVAIYEDAEGGLHEHIVTFWHAVERKKMGIPIIINDTDKALEALPDGVSDSFLEQLPEPHLRLKLSMQLNEMFVLGLTDEQFEDALSARDYKTIGAHLYRVQKLATKAYVFRRHTETATDDRYLDENGKKIFSLLTSKALQSVHWLNSLGALQEINPIKVSVSVLGEIERV